ncbi:MAG: PAS domain S-box protein [Solirubrobacterales bacterium]
MAPSFEPQDEHEKLRARIDELEREVVRLSRACVRDQTEMHASQVELGASEAVNQQLRHANAELEASRAAHRASEERLRTILESATDYAIIATDRRGQITTWNAGARRILGWTAEEALGQDARLIFTPEDRQAGIPDREIETALRQGRADDERWHLRKDGSRFWAKGSMMRIGDGAGFLKILRDQTAERQTAEALAAANKRAFDILESIGDAFYAVDHEWRLTYVNHKAEELWGRRREDLIGRNFWDQFPQAIGSLPFEAHLRAARERRPVQMEVRSSILDHWVDLSIYPSDAGLSVYFRDITERKQAEGALEEAKREAEQANLSKSKFLAAASHDLRQPMQSLLLFVEVLAPHVAPPGKEALQHLSRGLDALKELLDSLLDISRLDAGVVQPLIETLPLQPLIDQIGTAYKAVARAKGLELDVQSCPVDVRSDRTLLARMVRNLVENAIKYTESGGVRLRCRRSDDCVRIEVEDSGIGIPREHLDWIWEEFHQVGNPERDRNRGLGLGLAIVQRLSILLGHPVDVRSTVGQGSVFSMEVPAGDAAGHPAADTPAASGGAGRVAVIVGEDATTRQGLRAIFQSWGYDVLAACCADEALGQLRAQGRCPDVVVSDHHLRAGATGIEVIRRIREACGVDLPAIILTAAPGAPIQEDVAAHNFAIAVKPVTARQLSEILRQFVP